MADVTDLYVKGDLHYRVLCRAERAEHLAVLLSEALTQVMAGKGWTTPQDIAFHSLIAEAGSLPWTDAFSG